MTPTKDEVARIARSLTKAQRNALATAIERKSPPFRIAGLELRNHRCLESLCRAGLARRPVFAAGNRLTPLGEQVSAFIRTGESDA